MDELAIVHGGVPDTQDAIHTALQQVVERKRRQWEADRRKEVEQQWQDWEAERNAWNLEREELIDNRKRLEELRRQSEAERNRAEEQRKEWEAERCRLEDRIRDYEAERHKLEQARREWDEERTRLEQWRQKQDACISSLNQRIQRDHHRVACLPLADAVPRTTTALETTPVREAATPSREPEVRRRRSVIELTSPEKRVECDAPSTGASTFLGRPLAHGVMAVPIAPVATTVSVKDVTRMRTQASREARSTVPKKRRSDNSSPRKDVSPACSSSSRRRTSLSIHKSVSPSKKPAAPNALAHARTSSSSSSSAPEPIPTPVLSSTPTSEPTSTPIAPAPAALAPTPTPVTAPAHQAIRRDESAETLVVAPKGKAAKTKKGPVGVMIPRKWASHGALTTENPRPVRRDSQAWLCAPDRSHVAPKVKCKPRRKAPQKSRPTPQPASSSNQAPCQAIVLHAAASSAVTDGDQAYEVLRGKKRDLVAATACEQCLKFNEATGQTEGVDSGCRHRFKAPPPPTPANFWDLTLADM